MRLNDFDDDLQRGLSLESFVTFVMNDQGYRLLRTSHTREPDLIYEKFRIECKFKDRMHVHPATGFEHSRYREYLTYQNVFILFMEPTTGRIYGNWLDILPVYRADWHVKNGIITTFKIDAMRNDWLVAIKERVGC